VGGKNIYCNSLLYYYNNYSTCTANTYSSSTVCRSDVKICRYGAHVLLHDKKYTKTIAHNYRNSASQLLGNSASISRVISTIRFT